MVGLHKRKQQMMKKYRVNAPIRSVKSAIKKRKVTDAHQMEISSEAVANYVQEQQAAEEPMQVASEGGEEKNVPRVKAGRISRSSLPLVPPAQSNRSARNQAKREKKKGDVVKSAVAFQRPLTKKKAKKMMREEKRHQKEKQQKAE